MFEEMWQRTCMERQARLLESQISVQNQQQQRLTDTLQEVWIFGILNFVFFFLAGEYAMQSVQR